MFNLFSQQKPQQQAPQQQQAQQKPAQPGQQPQQSNDPNAMQPGAAAPQNPLDLYSGLWDNTKQQQQDTPPAFSLEPEMLAKVSSSLDFTRNDPPELVEKATSGDMNAMLQLMNHVGRQAYEASLSHGATLTDKFVGARSQYDQRAIGTQVKNEMVSSSFKDVPNSHHPVVKQELTRIAKAMQQQYPDASPDDIVKHTKEYWAAIQQAMSPDAGKSDANAQPAEQDWDKFF